MLSLPKIPKSTTQADDKYIWATHEFHVFIISGTGSYGHIQHKTI